MDKFDESFGKAFIQIKDYNFPKKIVDEIVNDKQLTKDEDVEAYKKIDVISENINEFVNGKYNLFIYSDCLGNGKTFNACYLAYRYCGYLGNSNMEYKVYFVNVPQLLLLSKYAMNNITKYEEYMDALNRIKNSSLVIWDDIGVISASEYDNNLLYVLINDRDGANIFTSNYSPDALDGTMDARIIDRISDGDTINFTGMGFRNNNNKKFLIMKGIE